MSQDIRDYELYRVDKNDIEAGKLGLTATVGPTGHGEIEETRGVQITLHAPGGIVYARMSEPQIRDMIEVLEQRINPDETPEATGWESDRKTVLPTGEIDESE